MSAFSSLSAAPRLPLLALDTATETLAVALHGHGRSRAALHAGGAAASQALVPALQALLADAGLRLADVACVAYGRGPGAFTGLRTACSVAQGLALGLGCPVLALDSLMLVAEQARPAPGDATLPVAVVQDARMDEIYAARYRFDGSGWQVLEAPALWPVDALVAHWAGAGLPAHRVAGSALAAFGERLALPAAWSRVALPEAAPDAPSTPEAADSGRAAALLRLALQVAAREPALDAAEALPLYLRDKVAQTTAEREAARGARA